MNNIRSITYFLLLKLFDLFFISIAATTILFILEKSGILNNTDNLLFTILFALVIVKLESVSYNMVKKLNHSIEYWVFALVSVVISVMLYIILDPTSVIGLYNKVILQVISLAHIGNFLLSKQLTNVMTLFKNVCGEKIFMINQDKLFIKVSEASADYYDYVDITSIKKLAVIQLSVILILSVILHEKLDTKFAFNVFIILFVWLFSLGTTYKLRKKFNLIKQYYNLIINTIILYLCTVAVFIVNLTSAKLLIIFISIILIKVLNSTWFIKLVKEVYLKKKTIAIELDNSFIKLSDERFFKKNGSEVTSDLLFALYNNKVNKAIVLSGEWGSGKTYFLERMPFKYKEVDLLKEATMSNVFYSTFKSVVKPYNLANFKINFFSLFNNLELLYIVGLVNIAAVPFYSILMSLSEEKIISIDIILYLIVIICVLNFLVIQILPYITFSKDVQNNRFRDMYLNLISINISGDIIVFENVDRISKNEIMEVLEITNYLCDMSKIIIPVEYEYIKREIKLRENDMGETRRYLNRFFKDIIYLPNEVDDKINKMKAIAKEKCIFVAQYEWKIVREIIGNENSNYNIRELEYLIEKYNSKPITKQFSYSLYLHIKNINCYLYDDYTKLNEIELNNFKYILLNSLDSAIVHYPNNIQNSHTIRIRDLVSNNYAYSSFPIAKVSEENYHQYNYNLEFKKFDEKSYKESLNNSILNIQLPESSMKIYNNISKNTADISQIIRNLDTDQIDSKYMCNIKEELKATSNIDVRELNDYQLNAILCKFYINNVHLFWD